MSTQTRSEENKPVQQELQQRQEKEESRMERKLSRSERRREEQERRKMIAQKRRELELLESVDQRRAQERKSHLERLSTFLNDRVLALSYDSVSHESWKTFALTINNTTEEFKAKNPDFETVQIFYINDASSRRVVAFIWDRVHNLVFYGASHFDNRLRTNVADGCVDLELESLSDSFVNVRQHYDYCKRWLPPATLSEQTRQDEAFCLVQKLRQLMADTRRAITAMNYGGVWDRRAQRNTAFERLCYRPVIIPVDYLAPGMPASKLYRAEQWTLIRLDIERHLFTPGMGVRNIQRLDWDDLKMEASPRMSPRVDNTTTDVNEDVSKWVQTDMEQFMCSGDTCCLGDRNVPTTNTSMDRVVSVQG